MIIMLALLLLCLLLRSSVVMTAATSACHLFVTAVLPGLFPYMVLSLMLISRIRRMSPGLLVLLGWGGGSPTGARLLPLCHGLTEMDHLRLVITCGTMSPMFLLGTIGGWLQSPAAGAVCLVSVIAGGWASGWAAGRTAFRRPLARRADRRAASGRGDDHPAARLPLTFGAAVEQSARTMLLVCGTMAMMRVFAALAAEMLPTALRLPVTTVLEVTTGTAAIAALPLPLPWRTALIAGATGFGGIAILLQNRAVLGSDALPLPSHCIFQALHGGISFLVALGLMWMIG